MVSKSFAIGLTLTVGAGMVIYGLAVQKEEPTVSSTILSTIGATAGLLGIAAALSRDGSTIQTTDSVVSGLSSMANSFR